MQEHTNKDQDFAKGRRSNPIHIVDTSRLASSQAETLREVQMSLVRAEQNLYNLVQANQANVSPMSAAGFGFAAPHTIPSAFGAPAWAPGGSAFVPGAPAWAPGAPAWASGFANPTGLAASALGLGMAPAYPVVPSLLPATGFAPGSLLPASAYTGGFAIRVPACDVADEGKQFVCVLDLPGVKASQVELLCSEHAVTINAYRETEIDAASLVRAERTAAAQQRTITLPDEIKPSGAKATLSDGILTVTLPKANPTEGPRRIKVQG